MPIVPTAVRAKDMNQTIRATSARRLTLAAGVAALTLGWVAATPAFAQERGDRGRGHEHSDGHGHWRGDHRYGGYYRSPDVYYPPPPVIYQPYGYYQQPGASLNFHFPLRFR